MPLHFQIFQILNATDRPIVHWFERSDTCKSLLENVSTESPEKHRRISHAGCAQGRGRKGEPF